MVYIYKGRNKKRLVIGNKVQEEERKEIKAKLTQDCVSEAI